MARRSSATTRPCERETQRHVGLQSAPAGREGPSEFLTSLHHICCFSPLASLPRSRVSFGLPPDPPCRQPARRCGSDALNGDNPRWGLSMRELKTEQFVGRAMPRREERRLLTGRGRYVAASVLPRTL